MIIAAIYVFMYVPKPSPNLPNYLEINLGKN
jgi:hypothetical protein